MSAIVYWHEDKPPNVRAVSLEDLRITDGSPVAEKAKCEGQYSRKYYEYIVLCIKDRLKPESEALLRGTGKVEYMKLGATYFQDLNSANTTTGSTVLQVPATAAPVVRTEPVAPPSIPPEIVTHHSTAGTAAATISTYLLHIEHGIRLHLTSVNVSAVDYTVISSFRPTSPSFEYQDVPQNMASLAGRIALVTGASAGIGLATAKTLADQGVKVIACARNIQAIQDLSTKLNGNPIDAVKCDMSMEEEVLTLFKNIQGKYGGLDVLINNAGMGGSGTGLTNGEYQAWKNMLDLNILGLTLASREAIKLMESGGSQHGHIVNINSIVGHFIPPDQMRQFYSGTKHMLLALTQSLRKTVQPKNIRVTSVSPGVVETEFAQRSYANENPELAAKMYTRFKCLEAQDIARAILYALSVPAHVNIDELTITPTAAIRG